MFGEHMQDLLGQHIEDKDLPTRELTLEEALAIGMQLHQDDRLFQDPRFQTIPTVLDG